MMKANIAGFFFLALAMIFKPAEAAPATGQTAAVTDPCMLAHPLLQWRERVLYIGRQAHDAGHAARILNHTTRWIPYKQVEGKWMKISRSADPILDELSEVPLELYYAPDDREKEAALDLAYAYQSAIEQIIDFTHSALYYERADNLLSSPWRNSANGILHLGRFAFGVSNDLTRTNWDNIARNQFDGKFLEVNNALLATKLPEHRYGKLCHIYFPPAPIPAP
jgi:hypothetical protein